MSRQRVVIAGAGLAAARLCTTLRRKGFDGDLVLIGLEQHLPYDRPPLSKAVLTGERDDSDLGFDPAALDVQLRLGTTCAALDLDSRKISTDGASESYDVLVIATGASPIRLPGDGEQLLLRSIDDALALRRRFTPGARVVVIGASWIGAEVSTAALAAGCQVTCLEGGRAPAEQALGVEVGSALLPLWHGIDLRLETQVRSVDPDGVRLSDGTLVPADVVVTGVGVRPETGWLEGSGLALGRGVQVDEQLRASDSRVIAIGDVTDRWSPTLGRRLSVEHWDDAGACAATAVASVLAALTGGESAGQSYDPVPYFWSDQFGRKIQYVGAHGPADRLVLDTDETGVVRVALWFDADDSLTAWLGVDRPRSLVTARRAVGSQVEQHVFLD